VALGIVELYAGQSVPAKELLTHCQAILGPADSPAAVLVIPQMPMTPTGKIGKQDLIKLYGQ